MPRLKSAIKRVQTSERNRVRNVTIKSEIKTMLKNISDAVLKKDSKLAKELSDKTFAIIDRAKAKKILHLNNAARKKSRISRWLKKLDSAK